MLTTRLAWGMLVGGLVMLMVKSEAPVEVRASELGEVRSEDPVMHLDRRSLTNMSDSKALADLHPVLDLSGRIELRYPIELPFR